MGSTNRLYNLSTDFKNYIKEKKSKKVYSNTCYRSGDFTSIYFYPWSKIVGNTATYFNTIDKFVNQMKEWGVEVSEVQKELIKKNNISYCVCKPGSTELLIRDKYLELKDALEEYSKDSTIDEKSIVGPKIIDEHKTHVPTIYKSEDELYGRYWDVWD